MPLAISSTEAGARAFFSKPLFAVVGASTNQAKFGYKSTSPAPGKAHAGDAAARLLRVRGADGSAQMV